jgi:thioredoxin reductase (NADPH)
VVGAEALDRSPEVNLINSLAGQSAGLQVTSSSGQPGASARIVIRGESLAAGMSQYLVDQIAATENIALRTRSAVAGVAGDGHLQSVRLRVAEGEEELPLSALFVTIGQRPRTDWLEGVVVRDAVGFVLSGAALLDDGKPPPGWGLDRDPLLLETSVPGIFAAGDVRYRSIKRIASAVGEGAMAVALIHQYLAGL